MVDIAGFIIASGFADDDCFGCGHCGGGCWAVGWELSCGRWGLYVHVGR